MGWDFIHGATRADIIAKLTRTEVYGENSTRRRQCLAHTVSGNVLWAVWELTDALAETTTRYIGCDLLGAEAGYGWGYKAMEESMGPFYYTCPPSYLDMVPVANPVWRAKVYAYWQERRDKARAATATKPAIGQWMQVVAPWSKEWHGYQGRVTEVGRTKALIDRTVRVSFAHLVARELPKYMED